MAVVCDLPPMCDIVEINIQSFSPAAGAFPSEYDKEYQGIDIGTPIYQGSIVIGSLNVVGDNQLQLMMGLLSSGINTMRIPFIRMHKSNLAEDFAGGSHDLSRISRITKVTAGGMWRMSAITNKSWVNKFVDISGNLFQVQDVQNTDSTATPPITVNRVLVHPFYEPIDSQGQPLVNDPTAPGGSGTATTVTPQTRTNACLYIRLALSQTPVDVIKDDLGRAQVSFDWRESDDGPIIPTSNRFIIQGTDDNPLPDASVSASDVTNTRWRNDYIDWSEG